MYEEFTGIGGFAMKTLIVYFSWSGHTKMTAERIARVTGGNLFEIVPQEAYPRLYAKCAIKAKAELNDNARPAFVGKVENFEEYTDVIIGYPAWWHTCPMIILSFLDQYDFTGKKVHLFNTHMGSHSVGSELIREHCKGFVLDSKDANLLKKEAQIKEWLRI